MDVRSRNVTSSAPPTASAPAGARPAHERAAELLGEPGPATGAGAPADAASDVPSDARHDPALGRSPDRGTRGGRATGGDRSGGGSGNGSRSGGSSGHGSRSGGGSSERWGRSGVGSSGIGDRTDGGSGRGGMSRRERLRLTVQERLPLWWQTRCGVEPRALAALAVVLLVAAGFAVYHFWVGRPQTVRAPAPEPPRAATQPSADGAVTAGAAPTAGAPPHPSASGGRAVVVDVTGRVRDPGVLRLPLGARVADALKAAGGVRPGTDVSGLNRARVLVDGEQLVVGAPPGPGPGGGGPGASAAGTGGGPPGGSATGSPGGAAAPAGPVSLNSATAEQLDTLPGVGPVLVQHILDYRAQHGGFRSVDELRQVTGIGPRRFADLRPLVQP
ncbi:ComEA family DNA-binding protein [Streptomyces sp. XD-27]|uniref:ComEA family DNA-binding protein n=1 Tax=Streptomyces sp. XD-27 TaxID=3062779 RepID=UPI0026F42CCB|nr:ComEA family DNA-binding protein [Streptomyces sp. XD-27]WKX70279.1 ComEA family DNA-binding protein [Streptomyces sp. XD-27]